MKIRLSVEPYPLTDDLLSVEHSTLAPAVAAIANDHGTSLGTKLGTDSRTDLYRLYVEIIQHMQAPPAMSGESIC